MRLEDYMDQFVAIQDELWGRMSSHRERGVFVTEDGAKRRTWGAWTEFPAADRNVQLTIPGTDDGPDERLRAVWDWLNANYDELISSQREGALAKARQLADTDDCDIGLVGIEIESEELQFLRYEPIPTIDRNDDEDEYERLSEDYQSTGAQIEVRVQRRVAIHSTII